MVFYGKYFGKLLFPYIVVDVMLTEIEAKMYATDDFGEKTFNYHLETYDQQFCRLRFKFNWIFNCHNYQSYVIIYNEKFRFTLKCAM